MNRTNKNSQDVKVTDDKAMNVNKLTKTNADNYISFEFLNEKTWDDINISDYNPIDISKKIGQLKEDSNFDITVLSTPKSDWIDPVFVKLFGTLPNKIYINHEIIYINKFMTDLLEKFNININVRSEYFFNDNNTIINENDQIMLCLDDGLLIYKNFGVLHLYYSNRFISTKNNDKLKLLLSVAKSYRKPKIEKNRISIIYNDGGGLVKNSFKLDKREISLEENYNDDFINVSKDLIKKLNDRNKTGLFILHGEHGTGKTTYIRYLASVLEREVIFIPPDMVDVITSPNFIGFLMQNPDTVLIIEDGESAIQQRDNIRTSGVANILNMTDGLLSDCLNISIVVTFNTKTKNLDDALLRKGRLMKRYEFGKLSTEKSQKLLNKLGIDKIVTAPMRLSDIYYAGDNNEIENFSEKKQIRGFKK